MIQGIPGRPLSLFNISPDAPFFETVCCTLTLLYGNSQSGHNVEVLFLSGSGSHQRSVTSLLKDVAL